MATEHNAKLSDLAKATTYLVTHVDKLMHEVANRTNAVACLSLQGGGGYFWMHLVRELKITLVRKLVELLDRCVDVGEASVRIARRSIKLFSVYKNFGVVVNTDIANDIDSILEAIEDANTACTEFRLVDDEAERISAQFPPETFEKLRFSREGSEELKLLLPYIASLEARRALPIERSILELENWWRSMSVNTLRGVISSAAAAVVEQIISVNKEHIAHVCVYVHPFEQHFSLASNPALYLEFQDFFPEMAFGLDAGDTQQQIEGLLNLSYLGLGDDTLGLVLQDGVLRFIYERLGAQSEKATTEKHNYEPITIASSYARILNDIYDALASFIRIKIHIYNIRNSAVALLLQDFTRVVKPILELRRNTLGILQQVEREVKSAQEVLVVTSGALIHTEHTTGERCITYDGWMLIGAGDPLGCGACLLDNLLDHITQLSGKLRDSAINSKHSASAANESQRSFAELVCRIFSESAWSTTLHDLGFFDQQMSRLQLKRPSEAHDIWEQYHDRSGPSSALQLEELYDALPSLRALAALHCEIIHLPHYELLFQHHSEVTADPSARTTIPWLYHTTAIPSPVNRRRAVYATLPGGVAGREISFRWKPYTHRKLQHTS